MAGLVAVRMDRHVPLFGFCVRRKRGCKFASEKFPHRTRGDNDAAVCVWLRLVALLQVTESYVCFRLTPGSSGDRPAPLVR